MRLGRQLGRSMSQCVYGIPLAQTIAAKLRPNHRRTGRASSVPLAGD